MLRKGKASMLLVGIFLCLVGIAIGQPIVAGYLFRTFLFVPVEYVQYKTTISDFVIIIGAVLK